VSDSLEQVASEVVVCVRCPLSETRNKAVPGEGPANAQIMLIGEGPGFHEDQSGRPFVGNAGSFLNELLASIGMKREEVFICNVVKCRPPGNRDPEPNEIKACQEYLDRQIELINPQVIVTLGRFSMARWFPDAKISHIHGKPKKVGDRTIVPMYHPAAALHQPSLKQAVIDDFKQLPQFLTQATQGTIPDDKNDDDSKPPQAQQLSLF
jgi:DNA polymerase